MNGLDYIDLWKYFEERANKLKDRALTVSIWLLGFATAMLGFAAEKTVKVECNRLSIDGPELVIVLSFLGFWVAWYARKVVKDYGLHFERNFKRANKAREEIGTLADIWDAGKEVLPEKLKLEEPLHVVETATYALNIGCAILFVIGFVLIAIAASK